MTVRIDPYQRLRLLDGRHVRRALRALAERAADVPIVGPAIVAANRRRFRAASGTNVRLFNGIYPTFAAAQAAIPSDRFTGYDNAPSAYRVLDEWMAIAPYDYPIMFWLAQALPDSLHVVDWGGNVGLKFFAYRKYVAYPAELVWTVCEVPAVVDVGRNIAQREGVEDVLRFTSSTDVVGTADLLFAAGALQFIEDPLAILAAAARRPRRLLFSKLPLHDAPSAVTLHNMGTAFCPYHLFNRAEFIRRVEDLGYALIDEWTSPDVGCRVPFHPAYAVPAYTGLYFVARGE